MSNEQIDLRSDMVTRPSAGMRQAMQNAEVGDDVLGDDPTVQRLQSELAQQLGFEAGLFCPSGTQCNLVALMTHCQRGDEYIVGQNAHTYKYEGGGAAVLGSIQPQPIEHAADGSLPLSKITAAIKPADPHFARTRLLALENTIGGRVLPVAYCRHATALAHERGLVTHLDGARLFNAAVALDVEPGQLVAGFDSVSICLSKGLGAPVGSVLLGKSDFIDSALRWRKVLGGAMRQSGVLAAAGLYALEHNVARLAQDHENAERLAQGLGEIDGLQVTQATNMVFVDLGETDASELATFMREAGVLILPYQPLRLVTHLDIDRAGVERALAAFKRAFARRKR